MSQTCLWKSLVYQAIVCSGLFNVGVLSSFANQSGDGFEAHYRCGSGSYADSFSLFDERVDRAKRANRDNFWRAVGAGDVEKVKTLMREEGNLDLQREYTHALYASRVGTALHLASFNGKVEVVRILLEAGARAYVGAVDELELHLIPPFAGSRAKQEHRAVYDEQQTQDRGFTALHVLGAGASSASLTSAVSRTIVQMLLEAGADVNALSAHNKTPLHSAVERRAFKLVGALLEARANMDLMDSNGETVVSLSINSGSIPTVKVLIRHGVNLDGVKQEQRNNIENSSGAFLRSVALHAAASKGSFAALEECLDGGADVNAKDENGRTALDLAIENRHHAIVRRLKDEGAGA